MRKAMMRLWTLSILFLTATTTSCKTTASVEYVLPPKPEREVMPHIETVADYAEVILYYERLVEQWEAWGNTVEAIMEGVK